jgi:hypothetical protein
MLDWGIAHAMVSSRRYECSKEVMLNWGQRFRYVMGEGVYIRIPGLWVASCKRAGLSAAEHIQAPQGGLVNPSITRYYPLPLVPPSTHHNVETVLQVRVSSVTES